MYVGLPIFSKRPPLSFAGSVGFNFDALPRKIFIFLLNIYKVKHRLIRMGIYGGHLRDLELGTSSAYPASNILGKK